MATKKKKPVVQFTAQNVNSDLVDIFNELKATTKDEGTKKTITSAALLERMITAYTTNMPDTEILNENKRLQKEIDLLNLQITEASNNAGSMELSKKLDQFRNHDILTDEDAVIFIIQKNTDLEASNKILAAKKFELKDKQFVCEFEDEVSEIAKKGRSLLLRDGYIKGNEGGNYPNVVANLCVKNFFLHHYDKELKS